MLKKQKGFLLVEVIIVLSFIVISISTLIKYLYDFVESEKTKLLKTQLQQTIMLAIKKAAVTKETIAFCLAHEKKCFQKPTTTGLIFEDRYHDGELHHDNQIKTIIRLLPFSGELFYRSYPHYRKSLIFRSNTFVESDNGTFWFCNKQKKAVFGFSINRYTMIHELKTNKHGEIIDPRGKKLSCEISSSAQLIQQDASLEFGKLVSLPRSVTIPL